MKDRALDQPICATTSCQVYRGIPVPRDPTHGRWVRAVRRTDGEVLLHEGRPATTVYFSTSNGRTYANEDVFGSSPLPYLRPVAERDDGASPTSRWRVVLPFARPHRLPAGRRALAARPGDLRGAAARHLPRPSRWGRAPLHRRRGPPGCREHVGAVPSPRPVSARDGERRPCPSPSRRDGCV